MSKHSQNNDLCNQSSTMYGRFFNRLKKGCKSVKDSAPSFRRQSMSTVNVNERKASHLQKDVQPIPRNASSQEKMLLSTLTPDKSNEDLSRKLGQQQDFAQQQQTPPSESKICTEQINGKPCAEQFWLALIDSHFYKNWLKVGLALRIVCDYISPVMEEIVQNMHHKLLESHGYDKISIEDIRRFRQNSPESSTLREWVKDVMKLHRHPPSPREILRVSDVSKWPTRDGAWEVARVFMSHGYRAGSNDVGASAFDITSLLSFMYKCRMVDEYVCDFIYVKKILKLRKICMRSPRLEIDDQTLAESFSNMNSLLQDKDLRKHVERYRETNQFFENLEKVKSAIFDLATSARLSYQVLKLDSIEQEAHSSATALKLLRDAIDRILLLPQVQLSAYFMRGLHNPLNSYAQSNTKKTDANNNNVDSEQKKKLGESLKSNHQKADESEMPHPAGINPFEIYLSGTQHIYVGQQSLTNCTPEGVLICPEKEIKETGSSEGEKTQEAAMSSNSGSNSSSTKENNTDKRKRRRRDGNPDNITKNTPSTKRKRSNSPNLSISSGEKTQSSESSYRTSKQSCENAKRNYQRKLHNFLEQQPENEGAQFFTEKQDDAKYHTSVRFRSNYAIASKEIAVTPEEAEIQAAMEANRWVHGPTFRADDLTTAKQDFDSYSVQVVGLSPTYISFLTNPDLYKASVHLINNSLFLFCDSLNSHKVFLEATCKTTKAKSELDVEDMMLKSALQGNVIPSEDPQQNARQTLNDYCLKNGGTIPIVHTTEEIHPSNGEVYQNSKLLSFVRSYLSQTVPHSKRKQAKKRSRDTSTFADFLGAESSKSQRDPTLAEENAACSLLEKLGMPVEELNNKRGKCKKAVATFANDMNLTAAYHTIKVGADRDVPIYECVVSSRCLLGTRQCFTVSSDDEGFLTEDEASESAARNALILLGQAVEQS